MPAPPKSPLGKKGAKTAEKAVKDTAKRGAETSKKTESPATGAIAKVNGVEVAKAEFDKKYTKMTRAFTKRGKEIPAGLAQRYKESILKQLVDKELLNQEITKQKVVVGDEVLAKEFEEYKKTAAPTKTSTDT